MKALAPHEQRVFEEREELRGKIVKLHRFLKSEKVEKLPPEDLRLLQEQAKLMWLYLKVLNERIALFGGAA